MTNPEPTATYNPRTHAAIPRELATLAVHALIENGHKGAARTILTALRGQP